jgi:hypothetical protein
MGDDRTTDMVAEYRRELDGLRAYHPWQRPVEAWAYPGASE